MLDKISKLLTGDMLKVMCDMGHGDEIVIADANFPAETIARQIIRCPGANVSDVLEAISEIFPIDVTYTEHPALVMELTDVDKKKNMPRPESWSDYEAIIGRRYEGLKLGNIKREDFYERTKKACAVIITGEERIYGNLLLVKGCVL